MLENVPREGGERKNKSTIMKLALTYFFFLGEEKEKTEITLNDSGPILDGSQENSLVLGD